MNSSAAAKRAASPNDKEKIGMKIGIIALCAATAVSAVGAEAPVASATKASATTNVVSRRGSMVRATGGWITRTTEGAHILLADARSDASDIETIRKEMEDMCKVPVRVGKAKSGGASPYGDAVSLVSKDAGLVLFAYDGAADAPVLSVFPENRVALVNVTPLMAGVDRAKGLGRVERELWRALVYVGGGLLSTMPSVMRPVFTPKDLDGIECRMANPMETGMINTCAGAMGLARIQRTTYRNACRQGWAPAPTNEYQKAVWDQVHQLPTEPMKIKPETSKVSD